MTPSAPATRISICLFLFQLLGSGGAGAGEPALLDGSELFSESLDVRVVNLEVVVEKGGDRVVGLGADDFVLKVDGADTPIEFFTEIRGGSSVSAVTGRSAALPAVRDAERVGTRYLVFVDDVFTLKPFRNRVLRSLADDVERLQARVQRLVDTP